MVGSTTHATRPQQSWSMGRTVTWIRRSRRGHCGTERIAGVVSAINAKSAQIIIASDDRTGRTTLVAKTVNHSSLTLRTTRDPMIDRLLGKAIPKTGSWPFDAVMLHDRTVYAGTYRGRWCRFEIRAIKQPDGADVVDLMVATQITDEALEALKQVSQAHDDRPVVLRRRERRVRTARSLLTPAQRGYAP